jgi:KaiC/GvpD/RAD55 family RecA-like ATPase
LSNTLALPILKDLVPAGFGYGTNLLVEFESQSLWYETSLTIAGNALKAGIRTDYHTLQHFPNEVASALERLGLDVKKLREEGMLGIIDSYTVQSGFGAPKIKDTGRSHYQAQSVKLSDWSIQASVEMKTGSPEEEKRRLHIDDNTSVLLQYNDEKTLIDFWRTRAIPISRTRELAFMHSLVTGTASDSFYKQFEALCDGIIDLKTQESAGQIEHLIRVRTMRGRPYDSRWHKLRLLDNGEVTLAE